jgi:hypothetical protein
MCLGGGKELLVRPYRPGDEEGIVELLQLVFGEWPSLEISVTPLEYWRWKYNENPSGKNITSVALDGDRIVGCSHGIPFWLRVGSSSVLAYNGTDVAVHPDNRRMKLRNRMMETKFELAKGAGVRYAIVTSSNPILIESHKRHDIPFPHRILNLTRIRDINLQLSAMPMKNAWLMKTGFKMMKAYTTLRNAISGSRFEKPGLKATDIDRFDERIDEFWSRASPGYSYIVERSQEYLNWRYCDPRGGNFIVKTIEEEEQILGYEVLGVTYRLEEYPIGYVLELLALPDRPDAADALVKEALDYFDSKKVNIVNYQVVGGHPYEGIFKGRGFLNSRLVFHLFYQTLAAEDTLSEVGHRPAREFFVSWGDQDVLPSRIPNYEF